jgi:excinuclease ABC subunit C
VLYYLQRLRDEAHRFAITTHRAGRSKALTRSELDDVPGVGGATKRRLLNHFGSARGVRNASLADLENAAGIGPAVARRVYGHFHPDAAASHDTSRGAAAAAPAAPKPAARDVVPAATADGTAPET